MYCNSPSVPTIVPLTETPTHSWQKPADTRAQKSNTCTPVLSLCCFPSFPDILLYIFGWWVFFLLVKSPTVVTEMDISADMI